MTTNNSINLSEAGVVTYDGAGTFVGSTFDQFSTLIGDASNTVRDLGVATDGQLVIGSTGVSPVLSVLTPGSGISIVNAAGSITISASSSSGLLPWTDVIGTGETIVADNGYVADNVGLVTFTLPATPAFGDVFAIMGGSAGGGWTIVQNTLQSLILGTSKTTLGIGGSLSSTNANDSVYFVCTVAGTTWTLQNSVGNLTVV